MTCLAVFLLPFALKQNYQLLRQDFDTWVCVHVPEIIIKCIEGSQIQLQSPKPKTPSPELGFGGFYTILSYTVLRNPMRNCISGLFPYLPKSLRVQEQKY